MPKKIFTQKEKEQIIKRYKSGEGSSSIGTDYGCSGTTLLKNLKSTWYDSDYEYIPQTYAYPANGFDENGEMCGKGIHCAGLDYVLRNFSKTDKNLALLKLRVEFKDFAPYEPGRWPNKLRCKKAFVVKVVDPETLGAKAMLLNL